MTLDRAAQAGQHRHIERGLDFYATPPPAIAALLTTEPLSPGSLWDCAAGNGGIVRPLRESGYSVVASDIVERAFKLNFVRDFLHVQEAPAGVATIVSNPPYRLAEQFVSHAFGLVPHVILLLRLAFLESERRSAILDNGQLARVHVFKRRLPMMHRDGWNGPRASSAIPFAWFCWDRDHIGPAIIDRISWRDDAAAKQPTDFFGEVQRFAEQQLRFREASDRAAAPLEGSNSPAANAKRKR